MSRRQSILATLASLVCSVVALPTLGQTTAGAGTVIVLPLVAAIPSAYTSTVFVRNPNSIPITLDVRYYQSDSATPPGTGTPLICTPVSIAANLAVNFDIAAQCGLSGNDNFGQVVISDVTGTYKTNTFYAYSRTQLANGNGFSVEGFPVGNFSGATSDSLGLKATSAAPHYRSNCFVGSLGEPVDYQILLVQGQTGAVLGSLSGSIGAYHTVRILDVFATAGLGPDQSNVRATFSNTSGNGAAFIGYCTLETSDNGSADFRVAKSSRANDERQSRLICYAMDNCNDTHASINDPAQLSLGKRNIHWAIFDQPDFVKCDLVSDQLSALQIQLRGPTDSVQGTTPFVLPAGYNTAPYTAGGSGATSFYIYTGDKGTINSGVTTRWFIDVTASGVGTPTYPINYGIKCSSGNGISVPWLGRSV